MELAYAAGLFDGEGSVTITNPSSSGPRRHRVIVQVAMTHRPTIDALQSEFGGRVQVVNQAKYNVNARDRYDWRLSGNRALEFLRRIRPWLITKAAAVDIALEFTHNTSGARLTAVDLASREELRARLMEANRRGR